ncbi:hypothetical protein AYI69_g2908 [Smittium culicis]|uniref:Uncharacterized protein n=1 Tax=Smittium culicis TaxID=133412 RepID=A0A1R1YL52_9FUNG|nr:hypothetical protein AYI69_g2908 [Smittium culicis]
MYSNFLIYTVSFLVFSAAANVPGEIPLGQRKSLDGKSLCIPSYGGIDYDIDQNNYRMDDDEPHYELYFQNRGACKTNYTSISFDEYYADNYDYAMKIVDKNMGTSKRLNNRKMVLCTEIAKSGETANYNGKKIKAGEFFCHTEMLKQKFVEKDYKKFKLFLKRGTILQEKKVPNGYRFPGRKFAIYNVCEAVDYYYEISADILNGIESCTLTKPCKGEGLRRSILRKFENFIRSLQNFSKIETDITYNDPKH